MNFTTHGRPTSGRKARASSAAPSWRNSVGKASMAMPKQMPWERYNRANVSTMRQCFNRSSM
ncbi:hypothetical protein D3C79_1106590 [compost metagenome]